MSIKAKQVAGVTTLVVVIVAVMSAYHLTTLARLSLAGTAQRGEVMAQALFQRARKVVAQGGRDPYAALREDSEIRSILESSIGIDPSDGVTYAAIVGTNGIAVAHCFPTREGTKMAEEEDMSALVKAGPIEQLRAVYSDRTFEVRQPMLSGDQAFGTIRIGVSPLLVRAELQQALVGAGGTVIGALLVASMVAMLLAQWMLRPIHVIQSGLTRLGRGELDVRLDLPEQEFRGLGTSFEAVSAQLSAMGRAGAGAGGAAGAPPPTSTPTDLESVMDNLEDAVALFSPRGDLIFSNKAMGAWLTELGPGGPPDAHATTEPLSALPPTHPVRQLVERTIAGRKSRGPISIAVPAGSIAAIGAADAPHEAEALERLLMTHAIEDTNGRFLGAMLVARNLGYLSHIHTTLKYSRKLAALGRLMAGVAHEVKNPLNAMTIHLELLKQKLAKQQQLVAAGGAPGDEAPATAGIMKHVNIISSEIRRLDEVVVGFLKFARPDELKLQPVHLGSLLTDVAAAVAPEAETRGIVLRTESQEAVPEINADPGMLRQAVLNLALNACQAMPHGGTLRIGCRTASRGRVQIDVEDTGVGIPPEDLGRIFDLYFTTKEKGSGIGLSMVYRIVQLHDGEVEVESTPGRGTKFRLLFPRA